MEGKIKDRYIENRSLAVIGISKGGYRVNWNGHSQQLQIFNKDEDLVFTQKLGFTPALGSSVDKIDDLHLVADLAKKGWEEILESTNESEEKKSKRCKCPQCGHTKEDCFFECDELVCPICKEKGKIVKMSRVVIESEYKDKYKIDDVEGVEDYDQFGKLIGDLLVPGKMYRAISAHFPGRNEIAKYLGKGDDKKFKFLLGDGETYETDIGQYKEIEIGQYKEIEITNESEEKKDKVYIGRTDAGELIYAVKTDEGDIEIQSSDDDDVLYSKKELEADENIEYSDEEYFKKILIDLGVIDVSMDFLIKAGVVPKKQSVVRPEPDDTVFKSPEDKDSVISGENDKGNKEPVKTEEKKNLVMGLCRLDGKMKGGLYQIIDEAIHGTSLNIRNIVTGEERWVDSKRVKIL